MLTTCQPPSRLIGPSEFEESYNDWLYNEDWSDWEDILTDLDKLDTPSVRGRGNVDRWVEIAKESGKCSRCPPHGGENLGRRPRADRHKKATR